MDIGDMPQQTSIHIQCLYTCVYRHMHTHTHRTRVYTHVCTRVCTHVYTHAEIFTTLYNVSCGETYVCVCMCMPKLLGLHTFEALRRPTQHGTKRPCGRDVLSPGQSDCQCDI